MNKSKYLNIEDYVLYKGDKYIVEFYFTDKGFLPAKEYFDRASRQIKIKLLALVKYIAENGKLFDENKFRIVDKEHKIYEFKPFKERFFNFFYEGKKIIITNAYRKKGQKVNQRELSKAINIKIDYDLRVKGGFYYAE